MVRDQAYSSLCQQINSNQAHSHTTKSKQPTDTASAAFNKWSLTKSRYDRGLLLLSSIAPSRMDDDPSGTFSTLCKGMVCVDATLGLLHKPHKDAKTMKRAYFGWALNRHTFRGVYLGSEVVAKFTEGYSVYLEKRGEDTYLPTVKYIKAKKAKAGDNAKIAMRKALTPDQQISNKVWEKEVRRAGEGGMG